MRLQTQGLIIKETNVGENDKLIVILTRENGIVRAFADGARRMKGKNASATSLFCYADFILFKGKDTYKVNEIIPKELFFNLRYNLEGFSLAQYFCEIAQKIIPEDFEPADFLKLLLNSLHFLTEKTLPLLQIKAITEFKAACLAGFMPDLINCAACGGLKEEPIYFFTEEAVIYCKSCMPAYGERILLNNTLLAAMRHIIYSGFNKLYRFTIPDTDLKKLSGITEKYLSRQSDTHFKTLDFFYSIQKNC